MDSILTLMASAWVFSPTSNVRGYLNPQCTRAVLTPENWTRYASKKLVVLPDNVDPTCLIYSHLMIDPLLVVTDIDRVDWQGVHRNGFTRYVQGQPSYLEFVVPKSEGFIENLTPSRWLTFVRKEVPAAPLINANVYDPSPNHGPEGMAELLDECLEAIEYAYGDLSDLWMTNFDKVGNIDFPRTIRRYEEWWKAYDGPEGDAVRLNPVLQRMLSQCVNAYELSPRCLETIPVELASKLFALPSIRIRHTEHGATEVTNWITPRRALILGQEWNALHTHLDHELETLDTIFTDHAQTDTYVASYQAELDLDALVKYNV